MWDLSDHRLGGHLMDTSQTWRTFARQRGHSWTSHTSWTGSICRTVSMNKQTCRPIIEQQQQEAGSRKGAHNVARVRPISVTAVPDQARRVLHLACSVRTGIALVQCIFLFKKRMCVWWKSCKSEKVKTCKSKTPRFLGRAGGLYATNCCHCCCCRCSCSCSLFPPQSLRYPRKQAPFPPNQSSNLQ